MTRRCGAGASTAEMPPDERRLPVVADAGGGIGFSGGRRGSLDGRLVVQRPWGSPAAGIALVGFGRVPHEMLRLLLITGFLGGLTTFSTFSGESLLLLQRGAFGWAFIHTLTHVLGALGCAALGAAATRAVLGTGV